MKVIAIDGPGASGKSTLARSLGKLLDLQVIESGVYYRYLTHLILERGLPVQDPSAVIEFLGNQPPNWDLLAESALRLVLRNDRISAAVAGYSAIPEIRGLVNSELRKRASLAPSVIEGRDIGTVVFPETPWKIYLNVPQSIRESRRAAEGSQEDLRGRDKADTQRKTAPLVAAPDAIILDIGTETPEAVLAKGLERLKEKGFISSTV